MSFKIGDSVYAQGLIGRLEGRITAIETTNQIRKYCLGNQRWYGASALKRSHETDVRLTVSTKGARMLIDTLWDLQSFQRDEDDYAAAEKTLRLRDELLMVINDSEDF